MDRILVTGGAGYIGSHTCKALARAGFEPVTFDNLSTGFERLVKWGSLVKGDVCNEADIRVALREFRPVAVIHFAGRIAVGESVVAPWLHYAPNVGGTINLLNVMREYGVSKLVFSSSAAVYGLPKISPVNETSALLPLSPYGRSKLFAEQMIADFMHSSGLRAICLRYFNAAGADADGECGELHDPETHLIPLALDTLIDQRKKLSVNGDDYDTPDGTCVRDYIHVTDLANAHVAALRRLLVGATLPSALNVGTGNGFSVREILNAIALETGREVPHVIGSRRDGDPAHLVADSTEIKRQLEWAPKHSELNRIVNTAWQWHQRERTHGAMRSNA